MADKRISQLIERVDIANNDVLPIVASGATTTNKVTISTLQDWMQDNLDVGVTSVGITIGSTGTDVNVSGSPVTSSGNITINIPNASATARGVVSTGTQTFAGAKTFNSDLIVNGITVGKGIGANNGNNTAIGLNCLSSNTTGTLNTATGLSALAFNTGGNSNTANGANSLVANTTGGFNTASGNQSLYSNTTGQANTAIGINSLYSNTTGTYNIGVGSGAGYYIADGSTPNTTSDFSIYLGADTKASVDGAQNEVVIGYNAIGNGSNTVTIGNSSVTDNYFTGTIRSTALRLAESGTANATLFRNTSSDSSSLTNHNVIGFNNSNDIFVTTQNDGGFILSFNNSTSNKVYTLQDASGTLAFTSDIPSLAGYVTLGTVQSITAQKTFTTSGGDDTLIIDHTSGSGIALDISKAGNGEGLRVAKSSGTGNAVTISGGLLSAEAATLTGALNGTSASFSGLITSTVGNSGTLLKSTNATTSFQVGVDLRNTGGLAQFGVESSVGGTFVNGSTAYASIFGSGNATAAEIQTNGTVRLSIASTGAATFSSSVSINSSAVANYDLNIYNTIPRIQLQNPTSGSTTSDGLHIYQSGSDSYILNKEAANLYLGSNNGINLTISSTGAATFSSNVTINGTGNPALDVQGTAIIRGNGSAYATHYFTTAAANVAVYNQYDASGNLINRLSAGGDSYFTGGNLGIGVIPSAWFTSGGYKVLELGAGLSLDSGNDFRARIASNAFVNSSGDWAYRNAGFASNYTQTDGNHIFSNAPSGASGNAVSFTERLRLTSGGYLKASNTGTYILPSINVHEFNTSTNSQEIVYHYHSNTDPYGLHVYFAYSPNNGSNYFERWRDGNATRAWLYSNGGFANFQANDTNLSDERVKKDIEPLESYWDKFKAIEIVKFKYKDQTHDDFNIGVIAQQVESVAPEFVDVDGWDTKPELDEEGNEIVSEEEPLKSIYTADLHHATIKVLQEAMAKIEKLETEIDSLKNQMQ